MFKKKWLPVPILDVKQSLCIAFLTISDQYHNFYFCEFFLQNGRRRPFWMSENHFGSHFWAFRIDTQLTFFLTFDVGHFGCPKFRNFRSIRNFFLEIFDKMAAVGHFGCPKFTFDRNSGHFRSIQNFFFGGHFGCPKITLDCFSAYFRSIGHFGCLKFTFDDISGHFRSIRNLIFV